MTDLIWNIRINNNKKTAFVIFVGRQYFDDFFYGGGGYQLIRDVHEVSLSSLSQITKFVYFRQDYHQQLLDW